MKKLQLIYNIFLSNFKHLNLPYKIIFACGIWKNCNFSEELSINEIEKIFSHLPNLSWVDLTGGEITLREDILKNATHLSIFHISTNGSLSEKISLITKEIIKMGLIPVVNISIDGPSWLNDELKGFKGAYFQAVETFNKLCVLKKGYYYISCTISDYNINYLDCFISGFRKDIPSLNFDNLHFNIIHKSNHYYRNEDFF